jgi:hypothetical protein
MLLRQNTGQQAAILRRIEAAHARSNGSLSRLRQSREWDKLVSAVADVVAVMPLWKLQRVGGDEVVPFLYPNVGRGRTIRLKPGVAFCLRSFYGIVRNVVEGAWLNYVRSLNRDLLGESADIADFLFGADRTSLEVYRPFLRDLQGDRCFYCRRRIRGNAAVDHFVPWARYPVDLGHNFVLAHDSCNGAKSDNVAAEEHLEAWMNRNDRQERALAQFLSEKRLPHDRSRSLRITEWAYVQTAVTNGLVWVRGGELRHLRTDWMSFIRAASRAS